MDRLLCGDVGLGKTEIALRAALKLFRVGTAALLAPTTILADQHMRTFEQRVEGFGVKVACMNRFRSTKEKKAILEEVRHGEIDILIGTHALPTKTCNLRLSVYSSSMKNSVLAFATRNTCGVAARRRCFNPFGNADSTNAPFFNARPARYLHSRRSPAERLAVQTRVSHWDKALLRQACGT